MLKLSGLVIALAFVAMLTGLSSQPGCQDLRRSWTQWSYPRIRDMRHTVMLMPQRVMARGPDSLSVPTIGKDVVVLDTSGSLDYDKTAAKFSDPVAADDSSFARGDRLFHTFCWSCHGMTMAGNGPVAPMFMTPPDLMAEPTRKRADGFIYTYIRHGGVVMPSYGAQVSPTEAWNLVNYMRHMQKVSPR